MKFHEDPSSRNRVVPCGRTDRQRRTHMTNLIAAFSNFAHAPKNAVSCMCLTSLRFLALLRGAVLDF
jgi:hypothetical protein